MPSVFTRIIKGEIPCHKIMEDDRYFAFLDIKPISKGHALVILKQEIDFIFDLDDELLSGLILFAKKVAVKIKRVVPCKKVGMIVAGIEVPHAHIHLVPVNAVSDLDFSKAKTAQPDELAKIAEKIRNA